jgi:hypothetical protein
MIPLLLLLMIMLLFLAHCSVTLIESLISWSEPKIKMSSANYLLK